MKKKRIVQIITIIFLAFCLVIIMIPLLWCISLSFDRTALTALPEFSLIPQLFLYSLHVLVDMRLRRAGLPLKM